jgi:hypothetical protein
MPLKVPVAGGIARKGEEERRPIQTMLLPKLGELLWGSLISKHGNRGVTWYQFDEKGN